MTIYGIEVYWSDSIEGSTSYKEAFFRTEGAARNEIIRLLNEFANEGDFEKVVIDYTNMSAKFFTRETEEEGWFLEDEVFFSVKVHHLV